MAPVEHDEIDQQIKDVIQSLYQMMVQVSAYDTTTRPSREVLANEVRTLSAALQAVHRTSTAALPPTPPNSQRANHATTTTSASTPTPLINAQIPPELIQYVEAGRNPDIYTREFVELVRRGNQLMKGKLTAFGDFRDVLADTIASGMPELREDVARVVAATTAPRPTATTAAGLPGSGDGDGAARTEQTAAATTAGAAGHTTS